MGLNRLAVGWDRQSFGVGNLAVNLADGGKAGTDAPNFVLAQGIGNSAMNILGKRNVVTSSGVGNSATNILGDDNVVQAQAGNANLANPLQSTFGGNTAFNFGGSRNIVQAGPTGPFGVAGIFGLSDRNGNPGNKLPVTQDGTGVDIRTPLNP